MLGGNYQATLSNSIPTTSAQIDASNIPIACHGDSTADLTVLNPTSALGYSYEWTDLNTTITTVGDSLLDLPVGTYVLSALYTDSFPGCTTTDTIVINQITLIQSSSSITDVDCNGNSTGVISTTTQGGTPPYSYNWTPPQSNNSTIGNLSAGTYILSITDANNCQQEDTYTVTEPSALQVTIASAQTYILNATVSGGTAPYQYSWRESSLPNTHLAGTNSYTVGVNGDYYVIVTDANGCQTNSNSISFNEPTAVIDLDDLDINIYPNPFKEETTVDFGRVIRTADLRIYDVLGKLLNEYEIKDKNKFILEREDKVNGIYFMEIEIDGQKTEILKLIIE